MDLLCLAGGHLHHPEPASAPVGFAAVELATYLGRLGGTVPVRRPRRGPRGAWLWLATGDREPPVAALAPPEAGEWEIRPAGDAVAIVGATPGALVRAVYALLEAAGCRWSPHGPADEYVPGRDAVVQSLTARVGRPAFARRAWVSDLATWHYTMPARLAERLPADLAFVDWMAKTGATSFLFIRHANDTQWVVPELGPALAMRGLEIEGGGHALVELLPRERFATHPEDFPVGPDGRRHDHGNACTSSPGALALVADGVRAACDAIPGASGLHLWGLDLPGGGWCHCASCAAWTPSDQALRVCNAAAERIGPGRRVFHLAYHDTLGPPRAVRPHAAVWAEFAPRERCYAHAIDDPACARNAVYRDALARHLDLFAGRVDVFEYYADAILFLGCSVPLVEVIARDLDYYALAGVRGVSCLTFGTYSLAAYGVNVEAFARGARDPAATRGARAVHCARRYGARAAAMDRYLACLEGALGSVVTDGDVGLPPRAPARAARAQAGLDRALGHESELRRLLADAAAPPADGRLVADGHLLDYTLAVLAALRDWVASRLDPAAPGARAEDALAALAAATAHVHAAGPDFAGTWGMYDLDLVHAFYGAALRAEHPAFADLPGG
jgi:uncharacterized protein DUF4838